MHHLSPPPPHTAATQHKNSITQIGATNAKEIYSPYGGGRARVWLCACDFYVVTALPFLPAPVCPPIMLGWLFPPRPPQNISLRVRVRIASALLQEGHETMRRNLCAAVARNRVASYINHRPIKYNGFWRQRRNCTLAHPRRHCRWPPLSFWSSWFFPPSRRRSWMDVLHGSAESMLGGDAT